MASARFGFDTDVIAKLWQRPLRFALALGWAGLIDVALAAAYRATALPDNHLLAALFAMLGYPLAILGALWLCRRCRLAEKAEPA
uniref:Uncharacterized protein n=1 Tax=Rheinheimera sp. BAL341 TaxID=1708203 RepID=A0A486XMZ0_9GAMM